MEHYILDIVGYKVTCEKKKKRKDVARTKRQTQRSTGDFGSYVE